ncbi:PAS domain-containing protein [Granulicella cerasi]|uniref:histidine kinase n=1 Tax=Granulicella cerasi TaxID=741063 RepID=A0ABW1ZCN0_9BACT|nr:PAS domain-containing protein [Granulicella cerasi]
MASILEHAGDAVVSLDSEDRIASYNPAAQELFGIPPDRALNQPISSLWAQSVRELLREGETKSPVTLTLNLPHQARTVDVTVNPIYDDTGHRIAFTLTIRDMTERLRTEDALRKAEALAAAGRLAATVSHEINNPLEAITNLLFLLGAEQLSEAAREYLKLANLELERVSHLVKQTPVFY